MDIGACGHGYRDVWIAGFVVLFLAAVIIVPVSADDSSTALGVIPAKSDIANLAFANQGTGHYYFKFDQPNGGGLNAIHIASGASSGENYGDITTTTSQSGTFYLTDTGGRGYQDEAILLVAVKGNIPDNFAIHIRSSGYSWTPTGVKDTPPTKTQITYRSGAVDQTFTRSQFVYGSQTWKPAGLNSPSDFPLYYGQDTSDTSNSFKLMFVDLGAGLLGSNTKTASADAIDVATLTDMGAVKVEYSIENLDTVATFNVYAWNDKTAQGNGISWTNQLVGSGSSGYTVLGTGYADRSSEFPTAVGSAPEYHAPATDFSADVTSGAAPLTVQFTDTTVQSVKTWLWDFGDGNTSSEKSPWHAYTKEGTYTVSLTAANAHDKSATKTRTDLITVTAPASGGSSSPGSVSDGGGSDSSSGGPPGTTYSANFSASATEGLAPFTVQFSDVSDIPGITVWAWDFTGDGQPESTECRPSYVFRKPGNYSVNLTLFTAGGRAFSLTRPDWIHVIDKPSLDSDVGWISSDMPDANRTGSNQSVPGSGRKPAAAVATNMFAFSGVSAAGKNSGVQEVTIDTRQASAATSGNVVTLNSAGGTWESVSITLADPPVASGSSLTGTIRSVQAETTPITVPARSLGNPGVTVTVNLAELPDPGASITSTAVSGSGAAGKTAFSAAAEDAGHNLTDIAYTVAVSKTGIANEENGGIIRDAAISMAISPDWVSAHGGTGQIVIIHRADDGRTNVLSTRYAGRDASGNDLFTAVSPTGLSTFALAAVAPGTSPLPTNQGLTSGSPSPLGQKVAALLLDAIIVVGVIGTGLVLWRKL